MLPVVVYGAGGHGRVVADALERSGAVLIGFLDDRPELRDAAVDGWRVRGGLEQLAAAPTPWCRVVIGVGDNGARRRLAGRIAALGYGFACAVHPSAQVARTARMGPGTVLMANAVLNPGAVVGAHVIINTAATVDHDCVVGSYTHVAPGAHLAGGVTIGDDSFIGIGACVVPGVRIGCGVTVGAGAVVIHNVPNGLTVAGVPARPLDLRSTGAAS